MAKVKIPLETLDFAHAAMETVFAEFGSTMSRNERDVWRKHLKVVDNALSKAEKR